jgi:hypothetical protein
MENVRSRQAQGREHLRRGFVLEREYLRLDLVARAARPLAGADGAARVELRLGLRDDLDHAAILDGGVALQPQRREEHVVHQGARHRPRRDDVHGALHARVEQEVLAGDLAHRLHHALEVGVDEVERHRIVPGIERHRFDLGGLRLRLRVCLSGQGRHDDRNQEGAQIHLPPFSGQASDSRAPFRSRTM